MGKTGLTKVIRHALDGNRHVRFGRGILPYIPEVAVAPHDREARAERKVEARRADDGVHLEDIARVHLEAVGDETPDGPAYDLDVVLPQGFQITRRRCHATGAEGEVGDEELA